MNTNLQRVTSCLAAALLLTTFPISAQEREGACADAQVRFPDNNPGPGSLKHIPVIQPSNLSDYVRNRPVAIALGKALFWDMQVGSDGIQSCGSCHFRAGADPRSINQLNPGGVDNADTRIDLKANYQLTSQDFPFHKFSNATDRMSQLIRDVDDVTSSQGVKLTRFLGVIPGTAQDLTLPVYDPTFNLFGLATRRGEPRNTPTVINTAFNNRLFWDGRADNIFNGVNIHGPRDPNARVLKADNPNQITQVKIRIQNAALASQAIGPPTSDREMGTLNRPFRDIGKRLVPAKPLRKQKVAADDSVLAPYAENTQGLNTTYKALIEAAFQPKWWQANQIVVVASNGNISFASKPNRNLLPNEYTMAEYNFTLFFGLSIQLYEMTLISDDAPIDRYFDGDLNALTAQQKRGLGVFTGDAACAACHAGAEMTNNSSRILFCTHSDEGVLQPSEIVERMYNGNCEVVAYDQSFYNVGVRPTEEDLGHGANDPFGNPLAWIDILTKPASQIPSQELLTIPVPNIANPPIAIGERVSTKGTFKTPSLRNIELTAPYFHNGGQATLRQVVEFYNRGGDFREHNTQFIDFEIGKLGLTDQQIDDLVAFLKSTTDQRVLKASAPFDHPQLFVPNGHKTIFGFPVPDLTGVQDVMVEIPAVGRNGGVPLKAFLEQ